jgi:thiamine pyrophosphate-dependent acetolactate synthase large subunit-like protein
MLLRGIELYRGLPNTLFDEEVKTIKWLLSAPPSVSSDEWLRVLATLQERTQPLLRTHEADLRHYLLGERYRGPAGPVALNVPADTFQADVAEPWRYQAIPPFWVARSAPDPELVGDVVALLSRARRPLVIAGRGAVLSDARAELEELSFRTGAPIAETLLAKGWFGSHPHSLGLTGGFGDPASQAYLRAADVVLAFGATLTRYSTDWGTLYEDAKVVRVDERPDSVPDMTTVNIAIWADARSTARAILEKLPETRAGLWTTSFEPPAEPRESNDAAHEHGLVGAGLPRPTVGVDPRLAVSLLDEALPPERGLVIDAGNHMGVSASHFGVANPLDQYYPWEFGAIGGGMAVALGAALGRPERPTVAFLGDGSFMLALADAEVAHRYPVRLLVVVVEDGGFRSERGSYLGRGLDPALADYDNPDIAELAATLGYTVYSAGHDDELRAAVRQLVAEDPEITRPTLLRLRVDRFVANPELDRAFASYRPY